MRYNGQQQQLLTQFRWAVVMGRGGTTPSLCTLHNEKNEGGHEDTVSLKCTFQPMTTHHQSQHHSMGAEWE